MSPALTETFGTLIPQADLTPMGSNAKGQHRAVLLAVCSTAALAIAAIAFVLEMIGWLQHATWVSIAVLDSLKWLGIPEPNFENWSGTQKLWASFREMPVTLIFLIGGILFSRVSYIVSRKNGELPPRDRDSGLNGMN